MLAAAEDVAGRHNLIIFSIIKVAQDLARAITNSPSQRLLRRRHVLHGFWEFFKLEKRRLRTEINQNRAMLREGPRRTDGRTRAAQASLVRTRVGLRLHEGQLSIFYRS
jgi:hypothetical protein